MKYRDRPFWVMPATVLLALTVFMLPVFLTYAPPGLDMLLIFYIPYAPLAAWLSWKVYPNREELFWILQILAWSTFVLLCYSCFLPSDSI